MNGTPAGWYDDPEQPGQQRYWDGNAWTENRAPGSAAPTPPPAAPPAAAPVAEPPAPAAAPPVAPPPTAAPPMAAPPMAPPPMTPPPPGAPAGYPVPPPVGPPAAKSHKGLWIALGVIGLFFVLVIGAIAALAFLGKSTDVTAVIEKNLPAELESNFSKQGLDVTVSQVTCGKVTNDKGPFTTDCSITISGLSKPMQATITGTVDGSTVSVTDANSDTTLLDATLAVKEAQPVVAAIAPTVSVKSCTLSAPVVVVEEGLTFTCRTDSAETATFAVQSGKLVLTGVQ